MICNQWCAHSNFDRGNFVGFAECARLRASQFFAYHELAMLGMR